MKTLSKLSKSSWILRNSFTMASTSKASKRPKMNTKDLSDVDKFTSNLQLQREEAGESVIDFKFNKKRVRIISHEQLVPEDCEGVVYWMSRDSRVQDNWAFLFAQKLALKNEVPLHVCFCLISKYLDASVRQFDFLIRGLKEVAEECAKLNIPFHLLEGSGGDVLPQWVIDHKIGAIVCDFNPLRVPLGWLETCKTNLKKDVPLIQVDAHNIVPCWVASDKLEYSARTIRGKISSKLDEYLTEFPPVIRHPYASQFESETIDWELAITSREADTGVGPVDWARPGLRAGMDTLKTFLSDRIRLFADKRNDPTVNALSNLSPWFHFGQISTQRAALCVQDLKPKHSASVNAFLEEAIVRRELADNFCFYNDKYDRVDGATAWAKKTLDDHRNDVRSYIYTLQQLRDSQTHDDLWNSAQIQLVREGKMHGFLRMYWAKKILEWTPSPEEALKYAVYLNDHYSIDGRDPNGYVGCMWSICGIHDQGWGERAIFGKIRFMNYDGCKRKFDVAAFVARYGGKVHGKPSPFDKKATAIKKKVKDTINLEEEAKDTKKAEKKAKDTINVVEEADTKKVEKKAKNTVTVDKKAKVSTNMKAESKSKTDKEQVKQNDDSKETVDKKKRGKQASQSAKRKKM